MVQCVSKYACSCMKNQLVKKLCEQGEAFLDIATHIQFLQVDIHVSVTTRSTFTAVKTHLFSTRNNNIANTDQLCYVIVLWFVIG